MSEHSDAFVQSWAPQVRLMRGISLGLTIVGAWAAVWFTTWWFFGDAWPMGPMPWQLWPGAILAVIVFGGVGVAGLSTARRATGGGIHIDRSGFTATVLDGPVQLRWAEVDAVELRVHRHTRQPHGSVSPRSVRTRTTIEVSFAVSSDPGQHSPALVARRRDGRKPYTHVVPIAPSGPLNDSAERIAELDAALRRFAAARYAGRFDDQTDF